MLPSKLMLVQVLRDPLIRKTYSNLFIDFRNIFILRRKDRDISSSNSNVTDSVPALTPERTNGDLAFKDNEENQGNSNKELTADRDLVGFCSSPIAEESKSEDCCQENDVKKIKETENEDNELKDVVHQPSSRNELTKEESPVACISE